MRPPLDRAMLLAEADRELIARIEAVIRRDPGRRGLLGETGGPLGRGELAAAAVSLAAPATHAVIVTGFFIPLAEPAAAETDGPPGAVALADTLRRLGRSVTLVTDGFCGTALKAAAAAANLPQEIVCVFESCEGFARWLDEHAATRTHLVAVERVGPGYTDELLARRSGREAAAQFVERVPRELWSRCLNMRGLPIEEWTVDLSPVFESPPPGVVTIGIGDGGNEIGMGKFDWLDLYARLGSVADPRILCRVAADHAIIAGTSNWGSYGLAAATAVAAGHPAAFASVTSASQRRVLEAMVREGPAVDGISRRFEPTVDGLPLLTFLEPLEAIHRRLAGLWDDD